MKEYMPTTGGDPELVSRYAAGELSFDDIAEDRGPRKMTTMDVFIGQINDRGKFVKTRKLTKEEKARKAKMLEDSRIYEAQLTAQQQGGDDEDRTAGVAAPRRIRTVADGWAV